MKVFRITLYLVLAFVFVAEKKTCGSGEFAGHFHNTTECSQACKSKATMFAFGRGGDCDDGKCRCQCQMSGTPDGTCEQIDHEDYNLYRFNIGKSNVYAL